MFDFAERVSVSYHQIQTETLDVRPFASGDECWSDETKEKRFWALNMEKRIGGEENRIFRCMLNDFFAAALLALAMVSPGSSILLRQDNRDPKERAYPIIYMQNADGSK